MTIRVLLVEDSPVALTILKRLLSSADDIEVVGTARTGKQALRMLASLNPQVICTDLHMPEMDGWEFTCEVMATFPRPILVVSASVQPEDTYNVFRALEAGAVDIFPKPTSEGILEYEAVKQELIRKIRVLAGVSVFTRHRRQPPPSPSVSSGRDSPVAVPSAFPPAQPAPAATPQRSRKISIVGIGASTGGPQALYAILSQLPAKFPVPIVCVQHISEGFLSGLIEWLRVKCKLPVQVAASGEIPQPGTVYFPPEGMHLELTKQGRFWYSSAAPISGHRPSVDVTFKAIAASYGASAVGVLLTGMGSDGAQGIKAMADAGGTTVAQDEASCVVFGMPKVAIALGGVQQVLALNEIAPFLQKKVLL
ncbi:chemotaxis-specific protein-glutamate methyltransferase CheB [Geitlerinema sp. PCC 9228]|jgi:two-component system chemotaxis response regulator CheB|uniref:chemotaxis-specific protein-glutamate methyltransferase CheB n=1 Tax=Geitlerinema sp. PCC 9228 TaxID=111611 RepID=UPI0008F9A4D0|nr:chemotaxis-specific protein-glutamate methyltransferase CheB [Geitlerinema sp. PCC 9228]